MIDKNNNNKKQEGKKCQKIRRDGTTKIDVYFLSISLHAMKIWCDANRPFTFLVTDIQSKDNNMKFEFYYKTFSNIKSNKFKTEQKNKCDTISPDTGSLFFILFRFIS